MYGSEDFVPVQTGSQAVRLAGIQFDRIQFLAKNLVSSFRFSHISMYKLWARCFLIQNTNTTEKNINNKLNFHIISIAFQFVWHPKTRSIYHLARLNATRCKKATRIFPTIFVNWIVMICIAVDQKTRENYENSECI